MSYVGNQQRHLLSMLTALRPHWRKEPDLPARIHALLAGKRAFGSRDRRLYRELIYTALRYLPWIEPCLDVSPDHAVQMLAWLAAETAATRPFRNALIAEWPACPPGVAAKAQILSGLAADLGTRGNQVANTLTPARGAPPVLSTPLPAWFASHCPAAFNPVQIDALLSRAPLWVRLQTAKAVPVAAEFDAKGWPWRASSVLPTALELPAEADIKSTAAYRHGLVEVQDLGSQMILASVAIVAGERWFDACAGAGGKTLQLAALLGPHGRVDAYDIRPAALLELAERARRAGIPVAIAETDDHRTSARASSYPAALPGTRPRLPPREAAPIFITSTPPAPLFDGVLVDAPCSGSGTWRRAPHLKWSTTPEDIDEAARQQGDLLDRFSANVKPGGQLIYATCSLSHVENEDVVAAFLHRHGDFSLEPPTRDFGFTPHARGLAILPGRHNTDGFFVSALRRNSVAR